MLSKQEAFLAKHGWVRCDTLHGVWYEKVSGINAHCDTGGTVSRDRALLLQSCANMDNYYWKKLFSDTAMLFPCWSW